MVNSEEFVKRLEKVIKYYGLTASSFADSIGVQRSSISHLLTGRNKPSLEFVMKVVKTYPEVNLYWLLNGKGSFPTKPASTAPSSAQEKSEPMTSTKEGKSIKKIIIFYDDGSFEAYDGKNSPTSLL